MTTILYNNDTQAILGMFKDGYTVDGKPVAVSPPVYELEYIDTVVPAYDAATQKVSSEWVVDLNAKTYTNTWTVADKTQGELEADAILLAEQTNETLDAAQVKAALRLTTDTLEEEQQLAYTNLYPYWEPGVAYAIDDKVSYGSDLYKVVQAHTSQLDWPPDIVPALFVKIAPPGTVPDWVQPTGAHDAYALGAKVKHNGFIWESLIDANVWEPGGVGTESLWVKV